MNKGDVGGSAVRQETAPPGDLAPDDLAPDEEIVVTAGRYGEAKVAAESELGEDEIASHGSEDIQDLLNRLAPLLNSGGDQPVILINGKPAGFDRSILSYPTEALDRLAVLKPEAAAQYGEAPGKRVVNLILKKKFSMLNADAGANWATAGGQYGGDLSVARTAISGDTRWNVNARIGRDSALRKDERNVPPRAGVFDSIGFVSGIDGREIDPLLSAIAGKPVTVAAIPPEALSATPTLADFAAGANNVHAIDPDGFETFQPSRRTMAFNIGVTRPVGAFSVSLSLNASRSSSDGLRGLPMASLIVPEGSPWTPFASDVMLTRPFAGGRALRIENSSKSVGGSLTVNGNIAGWQANLAINYSRSWRDDLLETGVDVDRVQHMIDAGDPAFNPFGPWDASLLRANRTKANGENLIGRIQLQKGIADLPAGPLALNVTANASRSRSESRRSDNSGDPAVVDVSTLQQADAQISLGVPISSRGGAEIGPLGDLSLDLSASGQTMEKGPLQKRFGGGVNWSPFSIVQLRGSIDYAEISPSFELLDGPIVTNISRIFDYRRGEFAEPVWTMGGNPDLGSGSMRSLSLDAVVRPFDDQVLTLNLGYRRSVSKGAVAPFPELTPDIEAAFPERVTRDAAGRLIAVDARAINLARQTDAGLTSGIALRLPGRAGGGTGAAAANPLQFSVALGHGLRLTNKLQTRAGGPVIDQLANNGQSRHSLTLQLTAGKRGIGATLNGNWSSAARVRNAERTFHFKPPLLFNFSMFAEPGRLFASMKDGALTKGLKVSLDVQNLFNGYRRVTIEGGAIAAGYSHDEVDPLGRTVRITLRKKF
jgi:hypothetical protein